VSGVPECVPDDFRNRGREPRLFRHIEFKKPRNLRGPLPRGDDILIVMDIQRQK